MARSEKWGIAIRIAAKRAGYTFIYSLLVIPFLSYVRTWIGWLFDRVWNLDLIFLTKFTVAMSIFLAVFQFVLSIGLALWNLREQG